MCLESVAALAGTCWCVCVCVCVRQRGYFCGRTKGRGGHDCSFPQGEIGHHLTYSHTHTHVLYTAPVLFFFRGLSLSHLLNIVHSNTAVLPEKGFFVIVVGKKTLILWPVFLKGSYNAIFVLV